jgi:hypothetical protein
MMRRLDIDIDWLPVDDTVRHVSPNHLQFNCISFKERGGRPCVGWTQTSGGGTADWLLSRAARRVESSVHSAMPPRPGAWEGGAEVDLQPTTSQVWRTKRRCTAPSRVVPGTVYERYEKAESLRSGQLRLRRSPNQRTSGLRF